MQTLHTFGLARINETFYPFPNFGWFGAITGGLMFGIGMALVGTCGFGAIIRLAGGDLKSLVTVMIRSRPSRSAPCHTCCLRAKPSFI